MTPALKRIFIDQIHTITWKNKISPATINTAIGVSVSEIEIISLKLNQRSLDKKALQMIDKVILYHTLFLLEYGDEVQAWVGFKEKSQTKDGAFKSGTYYHTEWISSDSFDLSLEGLNMDSVYENFVRQIAGDRLRSIDANTLKEAVIHDGEKQKLLKEISALEKKIQKEKQFNRQMELNSQLKDKRKKLEEN